MYILLLAMIIVVANLPSIVLGTVSARLVINDYEVTGLEVPPVIMNDRVMVPARQVFEKVGGTVYWDSGSRQVTVRYDGCVLVMTMGQTRAVLNGQYIEMEVPPIIHNSRNLIPLRFPAEAFGFDVAWDSSRRAAVLHSPNSGGQAPTPTTMPPLVPPVNEGLATDISGTPIAYMSHPATNIVGLNTPDSGGVFTIVASSPITDVQHSLLLDNRLIVDIYNAIITLDEPIPVFSGVSAVRASQFTFDPNITRIVLELAGAVDFSVALSADRQTLSITVSNPSGDNPGDNEPPQHTPTPQSTPVPPQNTPLPPQNTAQPPNNGRQTVVVIDPGHGGRCPGAVHNGLVEKDLVLTLAHMAMEHLNANPNIRAYMTRSTDVTVYNAWRAEFANQKADLFVSIHANGIEQMELRSVVSGIETLYAVNPHEQSLGSFNSRQFAAIMQRNLISATGAVNRGPKPRPDLIVLRDTHMPAVLVEVGFLTNPIDAGLLATQSYQRTVARAIYEGILEATEYFN